MINLNNITLQRGTKVLLSEANVTIFAKQKIGVIGKNGCGKSSLFAMLLGKLHADIGELHCQPGLRRAHLSQEIPTTDIPALEYVLVGDTDYSQLQAEIEQAEQIGEHERLVQLYTRMDDIDGYTAPARAGKLLDGLGFSEAEQHKPVNQFSGGWRMRLNLAQTLMMPSDILLLDEPTNHLDLEAILWFEKWLQAYRGTLLLISHDREFLDATINHILHVEQQKLRLYANNYSSFEKQRAENLARQQAMHERQQKKMAHMMTYVSRFRAKASKARQAQSRLKAINKMEIIAAANIDSPFHFAFKEPAQAPNPIVSLNHVAMSYTDKAIFKDCHLSFMPGERIGLLGPNGAGKSTLIKLLASELKVAAGEVVWGKGVKAGYFAQHQLEHLRLDASPLQHLRRLDAKASDQDLRNFLGGFAFAHDMAMAPIKDFSGGEKARLALALLVWQAPNLLLLDEPTNHLDLDMRDALAMALQTYQGALIIVSHDRHLLRSTVDRFVLVADGQVSPFAGDLEDYRDWISQSRQRDKQIAKQPHKSAKETKQQAAERRKLEQREQNQLKKHLEKLENQIQALTKRLHEIEAKLAQDTIYAEDNKQQLADYIQQQTELRSDLAVLEKEWMQLSEELD